MKITKGVLKDFGLTEFCPGCEAHRTGLSRNHNETCRKRLEDCMHQSEKYKDYLKVASDRVAAWMANAAGEPASQDDGARAGGLAGGTNF